MTKTINFGSSTVTYQDDSLRMIEFFVCDPLDGEQASLLLNMGEVLKLKYFLEDSLKDFCND